MVRNYKPRPGRRRYTQYDPELIKQALKQHANSNESLAKIASEYKISKSVLHRRLHKRNCNSLGGQRAFSLEREEHIIKYINTCAPWQYSLQCWDLRLLIKFYLDRRPTITKRKLDNNLPGPELVTNFLKRNEDTISQRTIQNLSTTGLTIEAVLSYFHELKLATSDVDADHIVCYNDVVITDYDEKNKNERDEGKSNDIFVMTAAAASGVMLQPYIMYKEQRCYERTRRSKSMSKQTRSKLNANIFNEWFNTVILPFFEGKPGKKCLIGNYFSSRISNDLINICKEQNIHFVFLPDDSRMMTQPLHPLSQMITEEWGNIFFKQINGNPTMEELFRNTVHSIVSNTAEKIIEQFKITGLHPINPVQVLKLLPAYNETTVENVDEEFEKNEMMKNANMDDVQLKEEVEWEEEYLDDHYYEEMESQENDAQDTEAEIKRIDLETEIMVVIEKTKDKMEDNKSVSDVDPLSCHQSGSEIMTATVVSTNKSTGGGDGTKRSGHCCNGACAMHTRLLESILSSATRQEQFQERTALAMEAQAQALANIARLLERRGEGNLAGPL